LSAVILCNFDGRFTLCGDDFSYASLIRNTILATIAIISLAITPAGIRRKNGFTFAPILEVAELFAGIFITVTPIIAMLHHGEAGEFGCIFNWIAPGGSVIASRCFWVSGMLSSVLDNAPTFLIFFHLLSGNAVELMTIKAHLLTAISIATVFMGALTYIGNAPNLMVKSIAEESRVNMPSFVTYFALAVAMLFPICFIISCCL
jgi:Na+/H+ antiporter NhaD/arsenite permease-like protein